MAGNGHEPGQGHGRRGNRRGTFVYGYGWPYYGASWPDYTSGGSYSEEVSPAPVEPPAPVAEPICPEMLHWSDKLGKAVRYRLCDDPGAASATE
jgi:hypothetical protein